MLLLLVHIIILLQFSAKSSGWWSSILMHIKEMVMRWTLLVTVCPKNFSFWHLTSFWRLTSCFRIFTNSGFVSAGRVYILDMYNPGIYPLVSYLLLDLLLCYFSFYLWIFFSISHFSHLPHLFNIVGWHLKCCLCPGVMLHICFVISFVLVGGLYVSPCVSYCGVVWKAYIAFIYFFA